MRHSVFTLATLAIAALAPAWALAGEQEDKDFARQIATTIRDSGRLQNYSIGVKCKDGTVWIAGRVTCDEQMTAALEVAQDISGITQIVNSLTVDAQTPAAKQAAATQETTAPAATQVQYAAPEAQQAPRVAAVKPARPLAAKPARAAGQSAVPAGYSMLPAGQQQSQVQQASHSGRPIPAYAPTPGGPAPASYDQPSMPNYAWPSYSAYPNYASLTYPRQYSATAWPFIGPFYPYPQVPMGWRRVSLEWDDGWWFLDFQDRGRH